MVDQPGGTYWSDWAEFIERELKGNGLISPADTSLYCITHSVDQAVAEVLGFYRVYHSMRYVHKDPGHPLESADLRRTARSPQYGIQRHHFWEGRIDRSETDVHEANEPELADLPRRCSFRFDRHGHARLRQMVDLINRMDWTRKGVYLNSLRLAFEPSASNAK